MHVCYAHLRLPQNVVPCFLLLPIGIPVKKMKKISLDTPGDFIQKFHSVSDINPSPFSNTFNFSSVCGYLVNHRKRKCQNAILFISFTKNEMPLIIVGSGCHFTIMSKSTLTEVK